MPSRREIEAVMSAAGGWTRAQLAEWGVPWPPPKGWKKRLIDEYRTGRNPADNGVRDGQETSRQ